MADSPRPVYENENEIAAAADSDKHKGFLSRKSSTILDDNMDEKDGDITVAEIKPIIPDIPSISFAQLFRYSTKFELFLDVIGLIAAAAAGAAQPLMSLLFGNLTQQFVDFASILATADPSNPQQIPAAAAEFRRSTAKSASELVYIGVGMFACTYVYMNIWVYTGEVNARRIRERYLQAILRQDIAFFDNVGAGEVATRIQTDTHLVQQGISEKVALVVSFFSAFCTGFILAYIRSWRLALALSSILPCIAIMGVVMNKFISSYMRLSLKHTAEGGSVAEEVISTVRTAQAFGTQPILEELYNKFMNLALMVDLKAARWQGGGLATLFFFVYSAYALAFSFGTTLINSNHATAGEVVNVFLAILIGSISLALLGPEMIALSHGRGAAAKLYDTIDRIPEIDSASTEGLKPEKVEGEIVLENVKFSYPSRPTVQVAKGLNITFHAGQTAALVGASGSGKSTIVSLVERFYDPTSGAVKIDGVNAKDLNLTWLRSQIGLVSQEPVLFSTTIRENIAHGFIGSIHANASEEVKEELIKEASIKANAHSFITKLPSGYDTLVGERGFLLSGGQKQRVAIARAIVSDPKILLLDEATSALDTQSEGIVQDALDKAAAGRTTITIAHRLSTIKDADIIHVMGEGLVLESGTHNDLIQANGAYARLVQSQKLRGERMDADDASVDLEHSKVEKEIREEIPLGRRNTGHSLASDILEQKRAMGASNENEKGQDYDLTYLFKRLFILARDQRKTYLIGTVFACLTGMVYPALGIVYATGVSTFSITDHQVRRHTADRTALWFFVIAIISTVCLGSQNYSFASAAALLTSRLRSLSFKAMLRQDISFFDEEKNSTGSLTSQLSSNPQKVNGLVGVTLGAIIQSIACVIAGSVLGLVFIWQVGLVGMACIPLLISTGYVRLRVVVLKDQINKKAHADSAQLACEAAGSIRTVASLTREADCLALYSQSLEGPLNKSNRTALWANLLFAFSQAQQFWVISLVFWYGAILVSHREASTFDFYVALMSTVFGATQAGNVFSFVPDMSSAKGAGSDIMKLLDSVPEIDAESKEGKVVDSNAIKGHLRFDNIHFRYPTRPGMRVLRDLSLEVEPGTYIALVGASGSGKSTIIQLIERFYDPLVGDIYLDGEKITELNIQEYRKHLALVSQEPTLYAGTVRFNVLLGAIKPHDEVTQEEIENACRDANILEFIQGLPQGFDTEVGGKGSQLSGGQKQRIAIARALLRNPKVLLLDEATSALDSNSEKVVQAALDQAAQGRTTIAIAHRLSTIQNADRIYFIKEGRVSESGSHDQLLEKQGDYYEFVQLQGLN